MRPVQPYQQGLPTNRPGMALANMQRGRTLYGQNPQDQARAMDAPPGSLRHWMMMNGHLGGQQPDTGAAPGGPPADYAAQQQQMVAQRQQVAGQRPQMDPQQQAQLMARQAAMQQAMAGYNPSDPRWQPPYR